MRIPSRLRRSSIARSISSWVDYRSAWAGYKRDFKAFRKMVEDSHSGMVVEWKNRYPCLDDKNKNQEFDRHYVYHTAWAARVLSSTRPIKHIDISSLIYFSTLVSAFVPVQFYDYRPVEIHLPDLSSDRADLLNLPFASRSILSLSCMHVVEHIGLGRYGDPLDPQGDQKAMRELQRVIAPGGNLLFVTPVGRPCIRFNAHRIYTYQQITDAFSELSLHQFALLTDDAQQGLLEDADPALVKSQSYGCGCFWFKREP
jgi:SAM-dependent methyltransferase